jgi:ATP/maltotriose-dependent transcriptional regulator MalT/serine/threonine protein kinase
MSDVDPLPTQPDDSSAIPAELVAAGFADPEEIGRGGFGVVYRCVQPALDRTVAVKVLTADLEADNLERFFREQVVMGKLSGHPHIVSMFHVGATATGRPYLVMQYHPRGSLGARIQRSGAIGWQDALHVGVKMAGALETAHQRGILHRDVKPANILLTEYGEPQLTDFGIARISGGFETTKGTITGSPAYTAPEVLQGHPSQPTSDVYSLASTLFSAGTGHAVFERRKGEQVVAQFLRITERPMPDLRSSGLPTDVCEVIGRAMSRDPCDRPATAAEFGEQLRAVQRRQGFPVDDIPIPLPASEVHSDFKPISESTPTPYPARLLATPPAAATRFRPPTPGRALVRRDRLIGRMRGGQSRKLTVIHGPTGFGKSTLASQWCDVLTSEGVTVAWLTVDNDDNNLVWFLSHLIEAIRAAKPTLATELRDVLEERGDESERYVLTSLINEIDQNGEPLTLVIDDWHMISGKATIEALRYLLDNASPTLKVVVTSRSQSGLPMSRMRMQDELVEIDSAAMRFDIDESEQFLVGLRGLRLDHNEVEDLTASTDGWVAALQLASLSLRGCDDPSQLIGSMSGGHHAISEFLVENVLDTLEPSTLDFLMTTSITDRICGDLATALSGMPRGLEMLEEVEERDLFLNRIDEQWFAYHHLFADFLRHRLQRDQPHRVAELHRIASQWFAEHRFVSDAVDHALAAGDDQRAVQIIENDGLYMFAHSQMSTLIGWVDKLPAAIVQTHPRLQLALAWANILLHRTEATRHALTLVESTVEEAGLSADEIADVRAEADVVRALVALRSDHLEGIDEHVAPCLARPDSVRPFVAGKAANLATFAAAYRCDLDEVHRLQAWASVYFERSRDSFNPIHGLCFTGLATRLLLDLTATEECFRKALKLAKRSGGSHSYTARLASSLLGELLYDRGLLDDAERLLDEGCKLGPEGGPVDFKIARYVSGARVKALVGDQDTAIRRLHEGAEVAETWSLTRLRALVENERIRLGLPAHPKIGALPVVSYDARRRPIDEIDEITVQHEEASAIRTLLAQQDPAQADLACRWAQEWVDRLVQRHRPQALLRARRLLVACLAAAGRADEAKAVLVTIASQCAQIGSFRYLPDGGPHVAATLAALHQDQQNGRWRPEWPEVPADFLASLVNSKVVHTI